MKRTRSSWDQLVYVHVNCPVTEEADMLYQKALRDALDCISIRLDWITVTKLSVSATSVLAKAMREADKSETTTFLVIGSHGLCASGTGFIVVEDLYANGKRVQPASHVGAQIKAAWPNVPLFIDACYSTAGTERVEYGGHDSDPTYVEANFAVAHWAELNALERCTGVFGLDA